MYGSILDLEKAYDKVNREALAGAEKCIMWMVNFRMLLRVYMLMSKLIRVGFSGLIVV